MAIFSFRCQACGYETDKIVTYEQSNYVSCPKCGARMTRLLSAPARIIVNEKTRHRYGTGALGRVVLGSETGGLDIFVPSGGAMEQEEVDYVTEVAVDKERERVKKERHNPTREAIEGLKQLAYQTKPGQRYEVLQEAVRDSGLGKKIKIAGG